MTDSFTNLSLFSPNLPKYRYKSMAKKVCQVLNYAFEFLFGPHVF